MTTTIERRVTRMEETTDGGGLCPECGWDGDPSKGGVRGGVAGPGRPDRTGRVLRDVRPRVDLHHTHVLGRLGMSVLEKRLLARKEDRGLHR